MTHSDPKNPRLFHYHDRDEGGVPLPPGHFSDITLRDLFAAFSLAGRRASPEGGSSPGSEAHWAYADADAMLAARAKGGA